MKSLVIAEKPSVARDIARVLHCTQKGNGTLEGKDYVVTWALGHLVTLADPEEYDKKYMKWEISTLPMMPDRMKLVVIRQTGKQYNAVKTQLYRKDVNDIIIATDAGREGELVARWILDKADCHKPIRRLWISSVTDKAIKEGFGNLKNGHEYDNLYRAAVARAEADWLVGMNGTRALTCKYNAQLSCGRVQTPTLAMIAKREEEIRAFKPKEYYGLTLKAGEVTWTWKEPKSKSFRTFNKERAEELEIIHSNPEAYFKERKAAKTSYPVVEKSLNPVAEGCYTSQVRVKQKHRLLENEILVGEKMATQAELLYGTKYPKEEIHEAVRALLFSEFHDALPGSGTQQVEEDTLRLLDHGLELMSRVNCRSAIALTAGEAPIKEGSSCAFLYNPHPYPINGQFAFEVGLPKQNWDPCFYHPRASVNGEEVPTQSEMECSHFCIDWRKRVVVEATLKPCAMNRVDVWFDAIEKRPTFERISRKENFVFDNGKMRIEINPRTGLVDSWKVGDTEYLKPGSFCPVAIDGTYNSWGLWKNEPGARRAFTLLTDHEGSEFSGLYEQIEPSVRVIEDGKVRTVVEALFGWHNSKLYQRYILPKNDTHMDVEIGVYWNENDTVLKLMIPSAMEQGTYYGQVMFGREALAQEGQEVVAQRWNAWTDGEKTFTAVNGGSYGSSIEDGVIGLTLLHSAGYSAADFDEKKTLHEVRHTVRMEQGERKFAFRFEAGKTDLLDNVDRTAQAYNEEPYVLAFNASGAGEKKSPAILVDQANVLVSAWKKAENGEGYTLRLYESTGKDTAAVVALPFAGVTCPVSLKGFEIKTLHYDEQTKQLTEADLLD